MKIYVCGDTHIPLDIKKLEPSMWPDGQILTKEDYLIQLGDFGLLFRNAPDKTERYWTEWLNDMPWTTLFIDGNHENHYRLSKLNTMKKFNGTVGVVSKSIFHLKRGEVYTIAGKKFFTYGGAKSVDKAHRTEGIDWWREEVPDTTDEHNALANLEKANKKVDFIISHTLPTRLMNELGFVTYPGHPWFDPTTVFLEHIYDTVKFSNAFCGHFHIDSVKEKYTIMYESMPLRIV